MQRSKVTIAAFVTSLLVGLANLVFPSSASAATPNSMGFIGCSMAENVSQGYRAAGGTRMWGPYRTGGLVVQSWTNPNSTAWQKFDQQSARFSAMKVTFRTLNAPKVTFMASGIVKGVPHAS
jgi:hypothetical protein